MGEEVLGQPIFGNGGSVCRSRIVFKDMRPVFVHTFYPGLYNSVKHLHVRSCFYAESFLKVPRHDIALVADDA